MMDLLERALEKYNREGAESLLRSIPPYVSYKSGQYARHLPPRVRRRWYGMERAEVLHEYWQTRTTDNRFPYDSANALDDYVEGRARSQLLVDIVNSIAATDETIMELGCGVGRNLHYLHEQGYHRVAGLDINPEAFDVLEDEYPDLAADADLYAGAIEELVPEFETDQFDVVLTMATLGHIHRDNEWVFDEIARITGDWLVTVEDELTYHWRHTPRDYADVFASRGFEQVETITSEAFPPAVDLHAGYVARVFERAG